MYLKILKKANFILPIVIYLLLYIAVIPHLDTVWELPDEAGYLWNAAFFNGCNWDNITQITYYGYGYSLFISMVWKFVTDGFALIKYAYIINCFFVIATYIVLILILKRLDNKGDRNPILPWISFVALLNPYVVTSTFKVICETCILFFFNLLILFLLNLIRNSNIINWCGVSIIASFLPFIHIRMIIIDIIVFLFIFVYFFKEYRIKKEGKKLIFFLMLSAFLFTMFYLLKRCLINYKWMNQIQHGLERNESGLITCKSIVLFIITAIDKLPKYILVFISKIIYFTFASGGTFFWAIEYVLSNILHRRKNEKSFFFIIMFCVVSTISVILAHSVVSTPENIRVIFYGRYYEYIIPSIVSITLYYLIDSRYAINLRFGFCFISILLFYSVAIKFIVEKDYELATIIDSNRMANLAGFVNINNNVISLFLVMILLCISMVFFWLFYLRKRTGTVLIFFIILMNLFNDRACLDAIMKAQLNSKRDNQLVQTILDDYSNKTIYMIDDNSFSYPYYYSKLQVLMKEKTLQVLCIDELPKIDLNDCYVLYKTSPLNVKIKDLCNKVYEGDNFIMYYGK